MGSPFHQGEQRIQQQLGVRDKMERFGRQVIRDFMPEQHQAFYRQLPYVLVGHADSAGWPWASLLFGQPGFMGSHDDRHLSFATRPPAGDPLAESLAPGLPLGLMGIELHTRRRNRLSGRVSGLGEAGFELAVQQTFGNCPQYIQAREWDMDNPPSTAAEVQQLNALDAQARQLIETSDTFFVASYVAGEAVSDGVDVSHRGGRPGFVRVDDDGTLTIPDYLGNFHFNTLGNFIENPRAGLLFVDFDRGDLLMLTGTVEIIWDSPELEFFDGAQRLWTFNTVEMRRLRGVLPGRWRFQSESVNSQLTGTWALAAQKRQQQQLRQQWLSYEVVKVADESATVRSFYLKPAEGPVMDFLPGQFLTVRANVDGETLVRTYTVSSAPSDNHYRISVKRDGIFSHYLHQQLKVGDTLEARAPAGPFVFDAAGERPAVLIAAGVGITPIVAMARHALIEAIRTRSLRPMRIIVAARNQQERAFHQELAELAAAANGQMEVIWVLSQPEAELREGRDYQFRGRLDADLLAKLVPMADIDAYLCGPGAFMQAVYDGLRALNVPDRHIFAEAFGPASMQREGEEAADSAEVADEAIVTVVDSNGNSLLEQAWQASDGSLLEFTESHGMSLDYGCRSGQCGACRVERRDGEVVHLQETMASGDDVLLCCAQPKARDDGEMARLTLAVPAQ